MLGVRWISLDMNGAEDLPVAILVTRFHIPPNRPSELTGFFYFSGTVPTAKAERGLFVSDLLTGKCCQVVIKGRDTQIEELLRLAAVTSGWSFENRLGVDGCIRAAREHQLPFGFDNLEQPTGNGLPLEGPISFVEDEAEIARRLTEVRDELELTLSPDWSPRVAWASG